MSDDVDKRLAVHEAICTARYEMIRENLDDGKKRMTRIEYLVYALMILILLGPGQAATFLKHIFGI
jgi:5-bromo-4-chloroindolyl phosphate hydrolysis protein